MHACMHACMHALSVVQVQVCIYTKCVLHACMYTKRKQVQVRIDTNVCASCMHALSVVQVQLSVYFKCDLVAFKHG